MPPERRRVVLDEDINWKLAGQLHGRGRPDATAVIPEGLTAYKDGALIRQLALSYEPCVLVTWDNKMAAAHRPELEHHRLTLAVVDEPWFKRSGLPGSAQQRYIHDVVHRWLHRIEAQERGERRIYSPFSPRRFT